MAKLLDGMFQVFAAAERRRESSEGQIEIEDLALAHRARGSDGCRRAQKIERAELIVFAVKAPSRAGRPIGALAQLVVCEHGIFSQ